MNQHFIQDLENIIQHQLPGESAHSLMIPTRLRASAAIEQQLPFIKSAVAILLFEEDNLWKSVLIERPIYEGVHSGQMAFPGGKQEKEDPNLISTALREMTEEIGFEDTDIHHLGELTNVYIPVSGFMVYPQVFFTNSIPVFTPDPREVKSVITFPIQELLDPSILLKTSIDLKNGTTLKDMSYFNIENRIVWGATCLMLNELKTCIQLLDLK